MFTDAAEVSQCYSMNNGPPCFYTNGSLLSWSEAREFCESVNSTLPIISDENIDNVFQQFIVNDANTVIQHRSVWIDAYARQVNNSVKWHWINRQLSGTNNDSQQSTLRPYTYSRLAVLKFKGKGHEGLNPNYGF